MGARSVGIVGAAFFLLAGLAKPAFPACNYLPSASNVTAGFPSAPGINLPLEGPGAFPYKGALGRIDRVHLLPGHAKTLGILPDGVCVARPSSPKPVTEDALANVDDLLAAVVFPGAAGQPASARVYAAAETCTPLAKELAPAETKKDEKPGRGIRLLGACSKDGVRSVKGSSRVPALEIPLPTASELAAGTAANGSPTVRILVTRVGGRSARELGDLLEASAEKPCSSLCRGLLDAGGLACIDNIYALSLALGSEPEYEVDPVPCSVQMPPGLQANDFTKQCKSEPGLPADLKACGDQAKSLSFWQDDCGGVHVPFTWQDIRKKSDGTEVDRVVAGRTGTSRKKEAESPRVWVPGREFVGSTPLGDPQGTGAGVNWRRPEIDVWYRPEAPQEFGLIGIVDKDEDSIVHVFPRLRVRVYCDQGVDEACMAVEGGTLSCACDDRYAPDCACEPPADLPARYFACKGGTYDGMPCTRPDHCNDGTGTGTCTQKPFCQKAGDVWEAGNGPGTGTPCWTDDDCETTPNKPQCGWRLFDFSDRKNAANGVVALDAKIKPGVGNKRRGACVQAPDQACSNGGGPANPAACASGDCAGYSLKAGQAAPP